MAEDFLRIIKGEICPYCDCETKLVKGEIIYPKKLTFVPRPLYLDRMFYQCINDFSHYVGTYSKDNVTSLGRLADAELRSWKSKGHRSFDPTWKELKIFKSQKEAYQWLSEKMEIPLEYTHFGMFTMEQCKQAIDLCEELKSASVCRVTPG
jgi:hypothetical protein